MGSGTSFLNFASVESNSILKKQKSSNRFLHCIVSECEHHLHPKYSFLYDARETTSVQIGRAHV